MDMYLGQAGQPSGAVNNTVSITPPVEFWASFALGLNEGCAIRGS